MQQERRDNIKLEGKAFHRTIRMNIIHRLSNRWVGTSVASIALLAFPMTAHAETALGTSVAQVKVGTLPLLAALGLGIAVAVGAVIAFLQMTARGKESYDFSLASQDETEEESEAEDPEWHEEDTTPNPEYDDNPITDYTIPVTQIMAYSDPAEPAEENEPSVCGLGGEHADNNYRVLGRRLTFGRDPALCSILFPYEAGEISRVHCTLRFMEDNRTFVLEDHGSSNGTFLQGGERLEPGKKIELRGGQRFSLAGDTHLFELRDKVRGE
jgi:hypothetical protein